MGTRNRLSVARCCCAPPLEPPLECENCADGLLPDCIYVAIKNLWVKFCGSCSTLEEYCVSEGIGCCCIDPAGVPAGCGKAILDSDGSITKETYTYCGQLTYQHPIPEWFEAPYGDLLASRQDCAWVGYLYHPGCNWYMTQLLRLVFEGGEYKLKLSVSMETIGVCREEIEFEHNFGPEQPECQQLSVTLEQVSYTSTDPCCVDEEETPINQSGLTAYIESCSDCGCTEFDSVNDYVVSIGSIEGTDPEVCEQCLNYNGSFNLARWTNTDCSWIYVYPISYCSTGDPPDVLRLQIKPDGSGVTVRLELIFYCNGALSIIAWQNTFATQDCRFVNWKFLPYHSQTGADPPCCIAIAVEDVIFKGL